ncbi:hypothetical protein [Croceimicrobium sp.]|uniref:hypothetical protein n=1 Tax=Croceimicrobium sp. TaxID=2828340 RepID=UPI003BA91FB8
MKRFKSYWILSCSILFVGGIACAIVFHQYYPKDISGLINLSLGFTAAFASFVAIMLADTRIPKIKTELAIWSPNRDRVDNDKRLVVFKLSNQSNQLIKNMVILMNIPNDLDLYFGGGYTTSSAEFHEQAKTKILSFKQFEYLDSKGAHSHIEIRLGLNLDKWPTNRVIHISVLGDNMESQRYKISNSDLDEIKEGNSSKPFIASSLK